MIWKVCFLISICIILAGIILVAVRKEGRYIGLTVFAASVAMCFPVKMIKESFGFALAMSVSHSVRMFVVDTGIEDITNILNQSVNGKLLLAYKVLVCTLYICAPVFTAGVVLKYFSNFFGYIRLILKFRQDIYVFSELNERSIAIAESIWEQNKKVGIVFCKSDDKDDINKELEENIRQISAVYTMKTLDRMIFRNKNRKITYFAVSQSDNDNLNDTLKLIDKEELREKKNIYIYCFSLAPEAEVLLDSKDKGNLKVILFDEVRNAVYEQLFRHPLYLNIEKGEKINLLIIGGGRIGIEFLKAAVWCGQMNSISLKINLIDLKGKEIHEKLKQECSEIFDNHKDYDIEIESGDIFSKEVMTNQIGKLEEVTYCVVSLGNDDLNIKAAIMLQRYFGMKKFSDIPYICVKVGDTKKQQAVYEMYENGREWGEARPERDKKIYYNINPFGDIRTMFGSQKSTSNLMDYLARGVHLSYAKPNLDDKKQVRRVIREFYGRQGDRRSSIASGIHIKYKLWEMGYGILIIQNNNNFSISTGEIVFPENMKSFYQLEHRRWMAYIRSEGWRFLTKDLNDKEKIRESYTSYYAQFKNKNPILKIHPALITDMKEDGKITLSDVEEIVEKVNKTGGYGSYNPDYSGSDENIVNDMNWIVSGEWHKNHDWIVQEFQINEGTAKICKLNEMAAYFKKIYDNLKADDPIESVLYLRECIKSSCYGVLRCESDLYGKEEKEQCYKLLAEFAKKEFMPEKAGIYISRSKEEGDKICMEQ